MRVSVVVTGEFKAWYERLPNALAKRVDFGVTLLEESGVTLKHPYSSALRGLPHPIRELRLLAQGHPIRIFYAFDPLQQAVLLLAGDKKGEHDDAKWTHKMGLKACALFDAYLAALKSSKKLR